MDDYAHRHADDALEAFYARVSDIYADAAADARENLETYLKRHEKADQAKRKAVADGKMTQAEYRSWKRAQVLAGKRYQAVLNQVSWGYVNADKLAMAAARGKLADVYAEAANYTAYTMESNYVGTSFSLVNPDTVQQTLIDSAACMVPTVDASKDYSWNRSHVATALTKGVLLGESIPKIAERVGKVADMGRSAAVRTARTAMTGAENAGRLDMVKRAEAMGLDVELEWVATLDGRTRHSHRAVDGEKVRSGEKFSNGCRYPGDPQAPYAEICNCRCTLGYVVGGVGTEDAKRAEKLGGMSYAEWKAGKKAEVGIDSPVATSDAKPSIWQRIKNAVKDYADAQRVYGLTAPGFRPRPRKTVQLPEDEYAAVMSAIGTNYNGRFKGKSGGSMAVGDYVYRFEVEEPGVYRIIGKRKIEGL